MKSSLLRQLSIWCSYFTKNIGTGEVHPADKGSGLSGDG